MAQVFQPGAVYATATDAAGGLLRLTMDEYLSVPEYYGEVPPGDVISLAANPTVVARLTGADPAEVRRVIVTAGSPEELPPADELAGAVGSLLGVEGADHGYERAREIPDAVDVPRE